MKSIITKKEETKYYNRVYLLLPVLMGLIFSIIIFLIYILVFLITHGFGFQIEWKYILIAFGLGVLEGLSTIYITHKVNAKKNHYFANFSKKAKTDTYIPATLHMGFLNNTNGVLIVTKDEIEFRSFGLLEKKSIFTVNYHDAKMEIVREKNPLLKRIFTLTSENNILKLTANDKEYQFIIPCLDDVSHRLGTHRV